MKIKIVIVSDNGIVTGAYYTAGGGLHMPEIIIVDIDGEALETTAETVQLEPIEDAPAIVRKAIS